MKLLKCKLCAGEMDIIKDEKSIYKKVKCRKCFFSNLEKVKSPEIFIIRKRSNLNE